MTIRCSSYHVTPRQTVTFPAGTAFLCVALDKRFNNCQIWTQENDKAASEKMDLLILRLNSEVDAGARFIGSYEDNSGRVLVYVAKHVPTAVAEGAK